MISDNAMGMSYFRSSKQPSFPEPLGPSFVGRNKLSVLWGRVPSCAETPLVTVPADMACWLRSRAAGGVDKELWGSGRPGLKLCSALCQVFDLGHIV